MRKLYRLFNKEKKNKIKLGKYLRVGLEINEFVFAKCSGATVLTMN